MNMTNRISKYLPNDWGKIIEPKENEPLQPTQEFIDEALKALQDDGPLLANTADDLYGYLVGLIADNQYLTAEQRLQVRNYHSEIQVIRDRCKRLMALMSADYEAAHGDEDQD